jgi:ATP-dependent RNA helicase DDX35
MYDGSVGLSSLKVVPISQASAIQRVGRAGRTSEGLCYRLYTFSDYNQLPAVTMPEITRTELSSAILQLKALGIDNFMKLQWLTIPPSESIAQSLSSLIIHSIIDNDGRLTSLGTKVAEIPLDVKAACVVSPSDDDLELLTHYTYKLLDSQRFKCGEEILTIIAMTAIQVSVPLCAIDFDPKQLSYRTSLLFLQALQAPPLNSNVESSQLKKGYVMSVQFYSKMIMIS